MTARFIPRLNIDPIRQPGFPFHRSGWGFALKALQPLHTSEGVLFDSFLERTFGWHERSERRKRRIPYTEPWVGVLHNPPDIPGWHERNNAPQRILSLPSFRDSMKHCQGIYVLSDYLRDWLAKRVEVRVEALIHPTEIPEKRFSPSAFLNEARPRLVQVGWWLRKMSSLFAIRTPSCQKSLLEVKHSHFQTVLERDLNQHGVTPEDRSTVEHLRFLSNEEYDKLLSSSVVFCHLFDSSANNTIIECIARATPLLINPLPPVREYLGDEYPLYFRSLHEAERKAANKQLILAAHEYLKQISLRRFSAEHFRQSVADSSIYRRLHTV